MSNSTIRPVTRKTTSGTKADRSGIAVYVGLALLALLMLALIIGGSMLSYNNAVQVQETLNLENVDLTQEEAFNLIEQRKITVVEEDGRVLSVSLTGSKLESPASYDIEDINAK
jgi:hypothetical protein